MTSSDFPANVHVSTHPCLRAKLSQLRSSSTHARDAKQLVHEIATIISCEALSHALDTTTNGQDVSPLGYSFPIETISPSSITLVPILRSGLSMIDAVQSMLPHPVSIHHLGLYREKTTLQPVEYYNNLPYYKPSEGSSAGDDKRVPSLAIIVDPIIATGATIEAAIDTLRDWGVQKIVSISVLASMDGLRKAASVWPEGVDLWVGGVDPETDERGMIKPGLGDIGDRLYLTMGK